MPEQLAAWIRRPPVVVSGLLLLGLGVAFAATVGQSPEPPRVLGNRIDGSGGSGAGADKAKPEDKKAFRISGGVAGLVPGDTEPLVLTLTSANSFPISVTALSVAVGDAAPGCPAANLAVAPFTGPVTVPANGSATTSVDVTLHPSAPDACKATQWPLTYTGTAVKS